MEVPAARDSLDGGRGGSWKDEELEERRALISGGSGGGWNEEVEVRRPLLDVREDALMEGCRSAAMVQSGIIRSERKVCGSTIDLW